MAFKSVESILQPDPRFADLYVVELGVARRITLADHLPLSRASIWPAQRRPTSRRRSTGRATP
jgi:hypothetical protein